MEDFDLEEEKSLFLAEVRNYSKEKMVVFLENFCNNFEIKDSQIPTKEVIQAMDERALKTHIIQIVQSCRTLDLFLKIQNICIN